jgi:hypothetical protein
MDFGASIDEIERLEDSQAEIDQGIEQFGDATRTFVEELRSLGAPDIESGEEVEAAVDESADTIEAELETLEEASEGGVEEFGAAFEEFGEAVEEALSGLQAADTTGELEAAIGETPACGPLG